MRVVHVGKFYPPEYEGGLEAVVVGLNRELVRRGVVVTTIVAGVRAAGRGTWEGVDVVRLRSLGIVLSQPLTPGLARAVRETTGDLVHLHRPNPLGDLV